MKYLAALSLLLLAAPAAAQDADTVYMGIDLTAEPEPQQRSLGGDMRAMLDEGVELGCLEFTPPASFAQTDDRSPECQAYIARLSAASNSEAPATDPDNPLRAVPLQQLAAAAQSGNKQAQLELGIRFEEGIGGVEQNWDYALELYTQAGRATPARRGMVVRESEAGAGGGVSRGIMSPRIPGLSEARERRDALEERMEALED